MANISDLIERMLSTTIVIGQSRSTIERHSSHLDDEAITALEDLVQGYEEICHDFQTFAAEVIYRAKKSLD